MSGSAEYGFREFVMDNIETIMDGLLEVLPDADAMKALEALPESILESRENSLSYFGDVLANMVGDVSETQFRRIYEKLEGEFVDRWDDLVISSDPLDLQIPSLEWKQLLSKLRKQQRQGKTESHTYILGAHGVEDHCLPLFKLKPGENVIMLCKEGCPMIDKRLSDEFYAKHLLRVKSQEELYALLKNPAIAAKKYAVLSNYLNDILCNFTDHVPNLSLNFAKTYFITGQFHTPIHMTYKQWTDQIPPDRGYYSYAGAPYDEDGVYLSDIIDNIRMREPKGFTLVVLSCRSFNYKPPAGTKIRRAVFQPRRA